MPAVERARPQFNPSLEQPAKAKICPVLDDEREYDAIHTIPVGQSIYTCSPHLKDTTCRGSDAAVVVLNMTCTSGLLLMVGAIE